MVAPSYKIHEKSVSFSVLNRRIRYNQAMGTKILIGIVVIVAVGIGVFLVFLPSSVPPTEEQVIDEVVAQDPANVPPQVTVLPYGNVTLKVGETARFKGLSVKAISIEEDSRCPTDVQCVWAGTVRVKIQVVSGMGTSTSVVTLNQPFTTEVERITLTSVMPNTHSQTQISAGDYRLVFNVVLRPVPSAGNPPAKCYIGGCSAQLCTDQPDAMSTCEYKESYACYKTAVCERQTNGQCGWTQTPQLAACLASSQ